MQKKIYLKFIPEICHKLLVLYRQTLPVSIDLEVIINWLVR